MGWKRPHVSAAGAEAVTPLGMVSPLLHLQETTTTYGGDMSIAIAATSGASRTSWFDISESESMEIAGERFRRHRVGGGWVSLTATVGAGVYVAPRAMIRGRAVVVGAVRLFDEAVVEEAGIVAGCCTLRNRSSVGGEAILRGNVSLADMARVDGIARVGGSVTLRHFARVSGGSFSGSLTIS